nr:MAG TPA: hypothetical protein [Caudoviricetes sp.]
MTKKRTIKFNFKYLRILLCDTWISIIDFLF